MTFRAWPRFAAVVLLAAAQSTAVSADDVPFNSKLEVNAGGKAFEGTDGYVTLGGLAGVGLDRDYENGMAFIDLAGHQLIEGDQAYNASLGYRWADWSDGTVWGVNAGLSGRSKDGDWYTWCNFGVERLAPDFDVRANGYLLCGDGEHDARCEAQGFEGNSLIVANRGDLGMQGFDLSIGADDSSVFGQPLIGDTSLYGKLEFYWFTAQYDDDALGGRAELNWQLHDNVAVSGWVSYDTLFETSGLVGLTVSLGGPAERSDRKDELGTGERLVTFIERRNLMAIHEDAYDGGSERAVADENGDPLPFWHVDNTAAAGGDGTYERPFDTLAEAGAEAAITGPGDVIIFHVGDGTTTNQSDGITLQNGQYFLGGGLDRTITFDDCDCNIADLLEDGRPQMTDTDGDALRLADNNTTGGYDIQSAAQQGVSGDGINNLIMLDVGIYNSGGSGIELTNSTGTFLFSGMTVSGNNGNFAVDDAGGGFNLLGIAGEITIEDTLCTENGDFGGDESIYDCIEVASQATGDLDLLIRNSQVTGNWGNGIETHLAGSGLFTAAIQDTLVADNSESGFAILTDVDATGRHEVTASRVTVTDNGWSGFEIAHLIGSSTLSVLIEDSTVVDNTTVANDTPTRQAGVSLSARGSTTDVIVRNSVITGHDQSGVYIEVSPSQEGGALVRVLIEGNSITGNGFGRVVDDFVGGVVLWSASTATDLDGDPVVNGLGQIEATLRDNLIDGNRVNGLMASPTLGYPGFPSPPSVQCVNIDGNSGADRLFLNNGTDYPYSFPPVFTQLVGGQLFEDPTGGGNANPVLRSGTIGSRACVTPSS